MLHAAIEAGQATLQYFNGPEVVMKSDQSPLTKADLESDRIIHEYLIKTGLPILSEEDKLIPYDIRKSWTSFWLVDPLDGTKEFINKRNEFTINIALIEKSQPVAGVVYAPALKMLYFAHHSSGALKNILSGPDFCIFNDILKNSQRITAGAVPEDLRMVASKSHLSAETEAFIKKIECHRSITGMKPIGSSLKLCMVAEGSADIYPRLGPTMEWDTAAAHAVVACSGALVLRISDLTPLTYNKPDLLNPYFVVLKPELLGVIKDIISKE